MAQKFALTGGIACGKSMAEQCFADCGCAVLDADRVVWALESAGGEAVEPIVARFGQSVLAADGGIDRRALAGIVFADAAARRDLEAIVLPRVRQRAEAWFASLPAGSIGIFSAALLVECGWAADWAGRMVCVVASEATQLRRMMATRGMTEAEARARLAAQMPVADKARMAQWRLQNDSDDRAALMAQVQALVALWQRGAEVCAPEGSVGTR